MNGIADWIKDRDRALVMGILNITPDSFYDGGSYATPHAAVRRGIELESQGADLLDIGGESSRPGANEISVQEEMDRVLPVIEGLRRESAIPISIDTTKAAVAREALSLGASIVNDISALRFDPEMAATVAASGADIVLMHMLGTPRTMQQHPAYMDVVEEIHSFFAERIANAVQSGISRDRVLLDPGIGFGKTLEHNLALLQGLRRFSDLDLPIVVGLSRKSFLGKLSNGAPADRLAGTIAANAIAIARGADMIRVHDVKEARQTADVAVRLRNHEF